MSETGDTRRLAAILAADVVGYSAMMSRDETGTLGALKKYRAEVFNPAVQRFHGRVVKLIGDGTLVEFSSVVDAVNCAVEIQAKGANWHTGDNAIVLRIGINLGDVIIDGDDIYGGGVNIAARLEPLAPPGGICVSAIVKESVDGRIEIGFDDGGSVQVKNIDRPIRVWSWGASKAQAMPQVPSSGPQRAAAANSVAVLPFENMSGDAEQEYFSDGISEDIITDLSKVSGLLVIARNSSFVYKGKAHDLRKVGRELGVRTVLEGSVRKAGNRVRVTAQLIDAETGGHLWADRFDRDLTDIFAVQDEITLSIVDALKVQLQPGEVERIADNATSDTGAHDCYLRALSLMQSPNVTADIFYKVLDYCEQALRHDPNYAKAHAIIAFAHLFNQQNFWTDDAENSWQIANEHTQRAIELDPNEPFAYEARAFTTQFGNDMAESTRAADKALELDPNSARSHLARGSTAIFDARPSDAMGDLETALRIDPSFSHQYLHFLGLAHYFLGNFEAATTMFRERLLLSPNTDNGRALLAAALGQLGEVEEAQRIWQELKDRFPEFSFEKRLAVQPYRDPAYPEKIKQGLRKAGVDI